jgi:hypothetical protein
VLLLRLRSHPVVWAVLLRNCLAPNRAMLPNLIPALALAIPAASLPASCRALIPDRCAMTAPLLATLLLPKPAQPALEPPKLPGQPLAPARVCPATPFLRRCLDVSPLEFL